MEETPCGEVTLAPEPKKKRRKTTTTGDMEQPATPTPALAEVQTHTRRTHRHTTRWRRPSDCVRSSARPPHGVFVCVVFVLLTVCLSVLSSSSSQTRLAEGWRTALTGEEQELNSRTLSLWCVGCFGQ